MSAVTSVKITGGNLNIDTANNGVKAGTTVEISGGKVVISTDDKGLVCAEEKIGLKAEVSVNGSKLIANY